MTLYPPGALYPASHEQVREFEIERIARLLCSAMEGAEYCDCEVAAYGQLMRSASGKWILPSPEARIKLWQTYRDPASKVYDDMQARIAAIARHLTRD
jgi:hypothetical protein